MPKMREVALEQKVNQLNAVVSAQADRIAELESLVRDWSNVPCRCSNCEHNKGRDGDDGCELFDRMRELGIEV